MKKQALTAIRDSIVNGSGYTRALLLAYAWLRGLPYLAVERSHREPYQPELWGSVLDAVLAYGDETVQRCTDETLAAWRSAPPSARVLASWVKQDAKIAAHRRERTERGERLRLNAQSIARDNATAAMLERVVRG